jgi:hypothetical protein
MSLRSIALRVGILLLSACAGGGDTIGPPGEIGENLKISYFRAMVDPRAKKMEPTYRVVMSSSWKNNMGESPKEPFPKAAPGRIYVGFLSDTEMARYFKVLRDFGIYRLKGRNPDEFRPEELKRLSADPKEAGFTRVFTIGTDKWSRSYYYKDHHVPGGEELIPIFTKCESFVARVCETSVNASVISEPLIPGRR